MRNFISVLKLVLFSAALAVGTALAAGMPAIVHKPSVEARQAPDFSAPVVATLRRNAQEEISGQQGLWYELALPDGGRRRVRDNDVRMPYAGEETHDANRRALLQGTAGRGRVTETATVRGIEASDLAAGRHDACAIARMEGYRLDPETAAGHASARGWQA